MEMGNADLTQHLIYNSSYVPRVLQPKARADKSHRPGSSDDPPPPQHVRTNEAPRLALPPAADQTNKKVHPLNSEETMPPPPNGPKTKRKKPTLSCTIL